jgi:hypothetical protein
VKSFLIDAENGEFIIPGGNYGFRIVPSARRAQRLNPPDGLPEYQTNPFLWGPRYYGAPGEFPVNLTSLDSNGEVMTLTNSDTLEDSVPLPTYKVDGAEPGSVWRVILRESPTERIIPSERLELGLLDLDLLEVPPQPTFTKHIRLRPCFRKLHLLAVPLGDPGGVASGTLYLSHSTTGVAKYEFGRHEFSQIYERCISIDVPPSGYMALNVHELAETIDVQAYATFEVG